jgi:hypothetical protein
LRRLGPGVNASLVGTTRRAGGELQYTYNKWPLLTLPYGHGPCSIHGRTALDR